MTSIMPIPPKSLANLVQMAKRKENCVTIGGDIWEFAIGNTVAVIIGPLDDRATGHQRRDPHRAAEIRSELAAGKGGAK